MILVYLCQNKSINQQSIDLYFNLVNSTKMFKLIVTVIAAFNNQIN